MAQRDNTGYQIAAIIFAFMLGLAAIVWAKRPARAEDAPRPWRIMLLVSAQPAPGVRQIIAVGEVKDAKAVKSIDFATKLECESDAGLQAPKFKKAISEMAHDLSEQFKTKIVIDTACVDTSKAKHKDGESL